MAPDKASILFQYASFIICHSLAPNFNYNWMINFAPLTRLAGRWLWSTPPFLLLGCHYLSMSLSQCWFQLIFAGKRRLWAPSQYPKRHLFVRSRKVSKPRDWYFKLSCRFEIWQAHRQHCCRSACQISERSDNSNYKSRGFETLRDLTERRLFGYWDGAQDGILRDWPMLGCK